MINFSSKAAVCVLAVMVLLGACKSKHPSSLNPGKKSTATNADFATKNGKKSKKGKKGAVESQEPDGFVVMPYKSQVVGPNLVFIEGGRFTMGALEEDVMNSRDNRERTVSVQSFYMDETEIANLHYLEYLHYIQRDSSTEVYAKALPDTTVWYDPLSFNDSYVTYYFRHPGFRMYPVVGVSWVQANDYSIWRTNFVNANLAKKALGKSNKGSLKSKKKGQAMAEAEAMAASTGSRPTVESGYVLPNYRLPTEAEWEYA
ncbi:MAG: SUMF1/EgtB/PvdO family nonheme iron enzyme, partial [Runella sp.]